MKKMILCTFLFSGSVLALEPPVDPMVFKKLERYSTFDGDKRYYCHLDSVYIGFSRHHYDDLPNTQDVVGSSESKTIVWNQKENRPYRCDEFIALREKLMSEYSKQYEEYERHKPPTRIIGPREKTR